MKEKIFRNFSLKILSALCAIILWTVIVNIYDPTTGFTISNVPVQLLNTESLTYKGYSYEVTDGSKISVYISGPKSVVTDIKAADIVATANLSEITAFADYVDIEVKVVKDGKTLTNVEVTPRTTAVKLNIENRVTQQFDVSMEVNGTAADGYVVTKQTISPTSVKITGPSTAIANISQVKAICDISGAYEDMQSIVPVVLYDADGNVIDDPKLELSTNELEYKAKVKKSKNVTVKYSVWGKPADGYIVNSIECSPEQIAISGDEKVLERISEITIPSEEINIDGLKSDKTFRLWAPDYMSDDIQVVSDNVITITVKVSGINTRDYIIKPENIAINGLSAGMNCEIINPSSVSVRISGTKETIDSVNLSDIKAYINVAGFTEGEHTALVNFDLPDGCTLVGAYSVTVNVKASSGGNETGTDNTQSTIQPPTETQGSSQ